MYKYMHVYILYMYMYMCVYIRFSTLNPQPSTLRGIQMHGFRDRDAGERRITRHLPGF